MGKSKSKVNKNKILLQEPKGMHDILPKEYGLYQSVYKKAEEVAEYYGFSPIQTPHAERTEIFTASIGESTDIIEKEMYKLKATGSGNLSLRPEGTAPIMRSYLGHGMHTLTQPIMLWYKGSFFRHERPQKGRFREFQQFGLEIIGEEKAIAEATLIKMLTSILEEVGIQSHIVHINSIGEKECRGIYQNKELLNYYRKKTTRICDDCKRRMKENPLRLLDCKEEKCEKVKKEAPQMINHLCANCKKHLKEVLEFLDSSEIPYLLNTHLVRGLDYYSNTVFEIFEDVKKEDESEGAPLALASGGRYDGLANMLSKKNIPAAGGAIGIDRLVKILLKRKIKVGRTRKPKLFFIHLGIAARYKSLSITEMLRKAHIPVSHSISKEGLKSQLKIASKLEVPFALILGQKESLENSIIIRNMNSRAQETVPIDNLVETLKKKFKK